MLKETKLSKHGHVRLTSEDTDDLELSPNGKAVVPPPPLNPNTTPSGLTLPCSRASIMIATLFVVTVLVPVTVILR